MTWIPFAKPEGISAERRYRELYRAWRTRMRLVVLVGLLAIWCLMLPSLIWPRDALFFFGLCAGSSLTLVMTVELAAPDHINHWRRGAEAERKTNKQLRRLKRHGWTCFADLADGDRGNLDHVAIAPSGEVFLLDTKAPGGLVDVKAGVLSVRWLEDPGQGYERDLTPRMKALAARLSADIGEQVGDRRWVTPVVVIWGRWSGVPHSHKGVAWTHGSVLVDRLLDHSGNPDEALHEKMVRALESMSRR